MPFLGLNLRLVVPLGSICRPEPVLSWKPHPQDVKHHPPKHLHRVKHGRFSSGLLRFLIFCGLLAREVAAVPVDPYGDSLAGQLTSSTWILNFSDPGSHHTDTTLQPEQLPRASNPPEAGYPNDEATCIPVSVLAAGYETGEVMVPVASQVIGDAFLPEVYMRWATKPYQGSVMFVRPQPFPDGLTTVLVPDWIQASDKAVGVFDFSTLGGPVFAEILPHRILFEDLEDRAQEQGIRAWDVFYQGQTQPLKQGPTIAVSSGALFKFVPAWRQPMWCPSLDIGSSVADSEEQPLTRRVHEHESQGCKTLGRATSRFFADPGDTTDVLHTYIAIGLHTTINRLSFGRPWQNSPLQTIVCQGLKICKLVAAQDRPPDIRPEIKLGAFAFVDPRPIGKEPTFLFLGEGWSDSAGILGYLAVHPPAGFDFRISGVPQRQEQVFIEDGCTLVVSLVANSPVNSHNAANEVQPGEQNSRPRQSASDEGSSKDDGVLRCQNEIVAHHPVLLRTADEGQALEDIAPHPDPLDPAGRVPNTPVLLRGAPEGAPPPVFIQAGFLVMSPFYVEEVVQLVLRAPCSVSDALHEVNEARDGDRATYCDRLLLPAVQPDRSFAAVLAIPQWATHHICVLVDARALDGRFFTCIIQPGLHRGSLCKNVGITDDQGLRIFVNGRILQDPAQVVTYQAGDVMSFVPQGVGWPWQGVLEEMLASERNWTAPCPIFPGPLESAFRILTDAWGVSAAVDLGAIQTSRAFRSFAATLLRYDEDSTTVCPSVPKTSDYASFGQAFQAIVVATERISRKPIPPAIFTVKTHVVFLDRRPMMMDFSWVLAKVGRIDYRQLIRRYESEAPQVIQSALKVAGSAGGVVGLYLRLSMGRFLSSPSCLIVKRIVHTCPIQTQAAQIPRTEPMTRNRPTVMIKTVDLPQDHLPEGPPDVGEMRRLVGADLRAGTRSLQKPVCKRRLSFGRKEF